MEPPNLTPPVKPKPAKTGAVASSPAAPPAPASSFSSAEPRLLEPDGSYTFLHTINPQETRRLLTRTGRATREEMERELPRYVERIVKRAVESEIY